MPLFDAHTHSLQSIFVDMPLAVPQYQRSYSWESTEVNDLWTDLIDNWTAENTAQLTFADPYFLGTIVTVPGKIEAPRIVLDGQQRLATLTILFAAIRDALTELNDEQAKAQAEKLQALMIDKKGVDAGYQLTLNTEDAAFFRDLVQTYPPVRPAPTLKSHRRIKRAKTILLKSVQDLISSASTRGEKSTLLQLLWQAIAEKIEIVNVSVGNEEDAARVFELLNARGLVLSLSDLLRNLLITRAGDNKAEVAGNWDTFIHDFKGVDLSPFLRYSWMSRHGYISSGRSAYRTIKSEIDRLKISSSDYIAELAHDSAIFQMLNEQDVIDRKDRRKSDLIFGFSVMRLRQAIPLLFVVLSKYPSEFVRTLERINALTFRFSVVGTSPAQLEDPYVKLAIQLRENDFTPSQASAKITDVLAPLVPSDESFAEKFLELSESRSRMQQYVLWELERVAGKHEVFVLADPTTVNVEHIYPQDAETKAPTLEPLVDYIGNLTLLFNVDNKALSNKVFEEKVGVYAQSEVELTRDIANRYSTWDETALRDRQRLLASYAVRAWKFE